MSRRALIAGGVLAALWVLCGWLPYALYAAGGSLATLSQLIPSPMQRGVFGSPVAWAVIVQVLMVIVLVAGFAALAPRLATGRASFVPGWLATILLAFAVGAVIDLGSFVSWVGAFGIRGAIGTMGAAALTTYWAVLVGWVPALVFARVGRSERSDAAPPRPRRRLSTRAAITPAIAGVALLVLPFAAQAGHDATQAQLREEQMQAQADADPSGAAAPDASAPGEPVPTSARAEGPLPADACTTDNTTIAAPAPDGATGHRGQSLQLINVSEEACVVDGYPDVAYGDQNDHLLDVTVEHGRSFMAEDPGPAPITLQPGESASAVIGWDANSEHGQLAARSLWIAVAPGERRLSWDIPLDIIAGSTVSVTAWRPQVLPEG
jgi:hypothetical protein